MHFSVPIQDAQKQFPDYRFIKALSPSVQKSAFLVEDARGQKLCLKIIAPDYAVDRVHREITAMMRADHPNVVRFLEYSLYISRNVQKHFVIEEFIEGTDLAEQLTGAPWELHRVARFFAALFDGLAELHRHDLVHRDVKPTKIRVNKQGAPVIIDLGQARLLDLPALTRTVEGAAIGTPAYFAPEQFEGTRFDIDARTDIFAAGVLLYLALTGKHPFYERGMELHVLRSNVCGGKGHLKQPAFTALPKEWRGLVEKLLQRSRNARPSHASEVAETLRGLSLI